MRLMLDEGSLVVPFLGPGTNSSDRSEAWHDIDSGYLPDGDELAAYLAQKVSARRQRHEGRSDRARRARRSRRPERAATSESIVPQQLLGKLRDYSHFLFLGYTMRDWNLRVFLKRVLGERQQPPNTSWAIQRDPDRLEIRFWERIGVELSATPLDTFVNELESRVVSAAAVSEA